MTKSNQPSEYELSVMASAVEWTCVRGIGRRRTVTRHATEAEAMGAATRDGRTMIYAISDGGLSAHVRNV